MARYFNNVAEAIAHYLDENPTLADKLNEYGADLAISSLPDKYNDTPYRTVIDGKFTRTVGEYKAICQKHEG